MTDHEQPASPLPRGSRKRLPNERQSLTRKLSVSGHEGYLTVGLYEDGTPGEIFITMSKEGSTLSGLMDGVAVMISLGLQYGVPLETVISKLQGMRFEPAGFTNDPGLPVAKSLLDYVGRYLEQRFLKQSGGLPLVPSVSAASADQPPPLPPGIMPKMDDPTLCPGCRAPGVSLLGQYYGDYECPNCHNTWPVRDQRQLGLPKTDDDNTCANCGSCMQPDGSEKVCPGCGGQLTVGEARHLSRWSGSSPEGIPCHACGGTMTKSGTGYKCLDCGETSGMS